ncbi:MAG: hypothetical protein QXT06_03365 [Candidatus Bathyarchaeia archaeon]|nr:hypothetical protein [Candidatus Bathyarchaeota archaeon]
MYSSVAALLLIVASVLFTCIVIDYVISIMESVFKNNSSPQIEQIRTLEKALLNHTKTLINQIQNGTYTLQEP